MWRWSIRPTNGLHAQHVVVSGDGIQRYPIELRYAYPAELDLMARIAGMRLRERWGGWDRRLFSSESVAHVSVYEPAPQPPEVPVKLAKPRPQGGAEASPTSGLNPDGWKANHLRSGQPRGRAAMTTIEQRYRALTPKSGATAKRAERVMPGGDTRSTAHHRPIPLTIANAEGPFLFDVDGNRYIDLLGNYTSLVHGNAYPPIVEAIKEAAAAGTAWPARSERQVDLAELLSQRVKSIEQVRFCNSGTEAGMLAAHVARRMTGRKYLLTARFGYHGSYDDLEAGLVGP